MVSRAAAAALAIVGLLGGAARADDELTIALYAPWGGPADAEDRHALVSAIESAVTSATGQAASGKVYTKYKDFESAAKGGKVDYAVMDLAPALRSSWHVLGTWSSGDSWAIVASSGSSLADLEGKRLALVAKDASSSTWLVETYFLRGEVKLKSFFSEIVPAPVPHDAARAIELGKAEVAVVKKGDAGGAGVVLDLGSFPELALVRVGKEDADDASVIAAAKGAVSGSWSSGTPSVPGNPALTAPLTVAPRSFGRKLKEFFTNVDLPDPSLPVLPLWTAPAKELP